LLRLPSVGRFLATVDSLPTVERNPGVSNDEVDRFVQGPVRVLQALLDGHFALHGSAVLVDGNALVITGSSGVGKSALVATLMRSGLSVAADGYVIIDAGTPPTLRVSQGRVELWPDTVRALGMEGQGGALVRAGLEKRAFLGPPSPIGSRVPVNRLVVLCLPGQQGGASTAGASSLELGPAMRTLASLGYLRRAVAPLGLSDEHFRWLTSLVSLRPVEICRGGGTMVESLSELAHAVLTV
jgi:hypothetical protein